MVTTWDLDGYFKIDRKSDGVYLTVYPPIGSGEVVEASDILTSLASRGIEGFNKDLIIKAIESADGMPIKILEEEGLATTSKIDDLVVMEISGDEMTAYLTLLSPGGEDLTIDDIKSYLLRHGVVYGIDEERLSTLLEKKEFNRSIPVARGRVPVPGQDAVLNFKFRKDIRPRPRIEPDGSVNFRKLDLIENATVGQVLVTKLPPTKGTPGKTVTGREVSAPEGKDLMIPVGKNTELSPDGLNLIATTSGRIVFTGARIDVEPVYEIKGDVDYSIGDIDFVGYLIIGGNITDGFTVKATGDIEVKGCIEAANVNAGGDVTVYNGIIGRGEGKVFAGGDITAKFIEHGNIEAIGNVIVQEVIMHSNVDAGGRVILTGGKKGAILGGRIRAGIEVNARTIGSWREVLTEIEVGVPPRIREEISRLEREIEKDKKNFRELKLGIRTLLIKKEQGGLSQEKEELLNKHLRAKNMLLRKLRDTMTMINNLQKELAKDIGGKVAVSDIVYPGTKICIRTNTMYVREEYKFVTFFSRGRMIESRPYEEPGPVKRKERKR